MRIDYLEGIVRAVAAQGIHHVTVEQCEMDLLAKDAPESLKALSAQDWFDHVVIEADPYRFPQQHVQMLRDFGRDMNLANIAPGQILRLEGFRQGVGRAVNYSLLSGDDSRPARHRRGLSRFFLFQNYKKSQGQIRFGAPLLPAARARPPRPPVLRSPPASPAAT